MDRALGMELVLAVTGNIDPSYLLHYNDHTTACEPNNGDGKTVNRVGDCHVVLVYYYCSHASL
jgi:hypothetical protein